MGEYYCRKCSEKKKRNLRRNFGVDYPIQNKKSTTNEKNFSRKVWG
jgi:hypothetical protein